MCGYIKTVKDKGGDKNNYRKLSLSTDDDKLLEKID